MELERGRALHPQLLPDLRLKEAGRGTQTLEGLALLLVRTEHADVHARMAEIWARLDSSHCHNPDSRVFEVFGDVPRENFSHGLVDPPHPGPGHPSSRYPRISSAEMRPLSTRTPSGKRDSTYRV